MTSPFNIRDGSELKIKINIRQNTVSEKVCFLELGSCMLRSLVNALDCDTLYSRSDMSDQDMVKIEAKLLFYD